MVVGVDGGEEPVGVGVAVPALLVVRVALGEAGQRAGPEAGGRRGQEQEEEGQGQPQQGQERGRRHPALGLLTFFWAPLQKSCWKSSTLEHSQGGVAPCLVRSSATAI